MLTHSNVVDAADLLADSAHAGVAMQVEEDAAASASQQQAQLLQESHTVMTAALEQVVNHGKLGTNHLLALHRLSTAFHSAIWSHLDLVLHKLSRLF